MGAIVRRALLGRAASYLSDLKGDGRYHERQSILWCSRW